MSLYTWAIQWGVSPAALADLQHQLGLSTPALPPDAPAHGKSEAFVQSAERIKASREGVRVFRNNVGALQDESGRVVRYGLANDSAGLNAALKSSDLVGWRPVIVGGFRIAQFWARECKPPGWQFTGTGREVAQKAFIDMVNADGGDAAFTTGAV